MQECFVDDMDETNAFGRGWIKKDYLEDFETYDNSEECLSCAARSPPRRIPRRCLRPSTSAIGGEPSAGTAH